ncbi:YLP motif protein (macronuclear) [Tetrahymena thermophila SB210]|uniref:YLP motif protein n=1 Tax=Tetrahymena thermophila (strain SB210) TaxID=312017 RepID=Q245L9_TETTS|nr:YLP motif protein [Tetrahymena thermophila SB210]EAS03614.2 YLP motif protein [Tetrahymena thermophila SB210]|eukprot:XP_001023859.2 YLP motif protein [Tetrahymena thermophila SB210]
MWLQIQDILVAHNYDGMTYKTSINTTYIDYPIPPNCPYYGTYNFDIRCRFYYKPTMDDISTVLFDPQVFYASAQPYLASIFCQRRLRYFSQDPNSEAEKYSMLCITLDLTQTPKYFQNFGQNSKFQIILDPRKLTVVYDSIINIKRDQILNIQQAETYYLQDQSQSKIIIENISMMSQYILDQKDNINELQLDSQQIQRTFQYNRNGTECFVIQNLITMVDKIPSFEVLKRGSAFKKFQLKSAFIFLDVLSKEKMIQYSNDLQIKIKYYNQIFSYCCWVLIILATIFQIYFSIILGRLLIHPIIHLTNILKQIKIKNQSIQQQSNNLIKDSLHTGYQTLNTNFKSQKDTYYQNASILSFEDQIQFEFNINLDFDNICFSRDTQELLNSFQNMLKILKFTNSNILKQNESTSLLNLNMQVQYFEKFCNYRALGVCYNNIGVIHYNSGRYQESVENFQKAVIFAKYELNVYNQQNVKEELSQQIKRFASIFNMNILENKNKNNFLDDNSEQKNKILKLSFDKYNQIDEKEQIQFQFEDIVENEQLYWNLFNRKENLLKSLSNYLNYNSGLWDIYYELAKENAIISKMFLPPSFKREMFNYYPILISCFKSKDMENAKDILKKISILYIKNYEKKNNQNEINSEKPKTISNFANKMLALQNNLLIQNTQDSLFLQKKLSEYSNQVSEINASQVLMSPIKKSTVKKQILKFKEVLEKEQIYSYSNQKRLSSLAEGVFDSAQYHQTQKQQAKQTQKNIPVSILQNQEANFKVKKQQIYQNDPNKKATKQSFFQKQYNTNQQHSQLSERNNKKATLIIQKENQKNPRKSNFQNFIQLHILSNTNKKFLSFYKVRKCKNSDKVSKYEFSSDVNFMYYALNQAQFLVQSQNFSKAATILTNSLESCKYYLPHLKEQALNILSDIFCRKNIFAEELEEMKNSYQSLINCNFHVYIISACQQWKGNKKICKISSDLLKDILFKDQDSFGLISYSFSESIFEQFMAQIYIQVIKSYPHLLELLLISYTQKYIQNDSHNRNLGLQYQINNNTGIQEEDIKNKLDKSGSYYKQYTKQYLEDYFLNQGPKYNLLNCSLDINENTNRNNKTLSIKQRPLENELSKKKNFQEFNIGEESPIMFDKIESQQKFFQQQCFESSPCKLINSGESDRFRNRTQILNQPFHLDYQSSNAQKDIFKNDQPNGEEYLDFDQLSKQNTSLKQHSSKTNLNIFNETYSNKFNGIKWPKSNQNNFISPYIQTKNQKNYFQQNQYNYLINNQFQSENQDTNQNNNGKQENQVKDENDFYHQAKQNQQQFNSKKVNQSSEEIFHLGIHAALKQFILCTKEKINIYLSLKKYKESQKNKQFQLQKQNQTILIYITDLQLQFKNGEFINELSQLLLNLDIQLLVLVLNQQQQTYEHDKLQDIIISGKNIIKFFNSQQKLLQYIYNQREHIKNNLMPMMIEYF